MGNITYTDKVAGAGGITGQWRAVDANEVKNIVNGKADSIGPYTTLSGTTWDGTSKKKVLTSNLSLTLSTTLRSGKLKVVQDATGGRTLTIGGVSIPILSAANAVTMVLFDYDDVGNTFDIYLDTSYAGNLTGGDLTAPTLSSVVIENATPSQIDLNYSEALDTGSIPATTAFALLKNGSTHVPTGTNVTGSKVTLTLSVAALSTDVYVLDYLGTGANKIQDVAGNDAATFSGQAVTNNVAAGGYDTDAQAIIDAIELTDAGAQSTGKKDAIDDLIVAIKAAGAWTNMKGLYGYVGGTANSHAINWKTPGTFDITWSGGITHSATGVLFNGTTGYGSTGINDNTHLQLDDVAIGAYSRTNTVNGFAMGLNNTNGLYMADRASMISRFHDNSDMTTAMTPTRLMVTARMTAAPKQAQYRDGTQLAANPGAASGKENLVLFVGAINSAGSAAGFSDKEYALHFVYDGAMNASMVTALTTAVNTFQTALSRNV